MVAVPQKGAGSAGGQRLRLEVDADPPHEQGAGLLRFVPVGAAVGADGGRPTSRGRPPTAFLGGRGARGNGRCSSKGGPAVPAAGAFGSRSTQTRPMSGGRVCCVSFRLRRRWEQTAAGPRAGACRLRRFFGDGEAGKWSLFLKRGCLARARARPANGRPGRADRSPPRPLSATDPNRVRSPEALLPRAHLQPPCPRAGRRRFPVPPLPHGPSPQAFEYLVR